MKADQATVRLCCARIHRQAMQERCAAWICAVAGVSRWQDLCNLQQSLENVKNGRLNCVANELPGVACGCECSDALSVWQRGCRLQTWPSSFSNFIRALVPCPTSRLALLGSWRTHFRRGLRQSYCSAEQTSMREARSVHNRAADTHQLDSWAGAYAPPFTPASVRQVCLLFDLLESLPVWYCICQKPACTFKCASSSVPACCQLC